MMNRIFLSCCALVTSFFLSSSAGAIAFSFASLPLSSIVFSGGPGGTVTFEDEVPGSYNDFQITNSNGVGDAVGLHGDIDGLFTVSAVITVMANNVQSALVSGSGIVAIDDGVGNILTADIVLNSIGTLLNFGQFNLDAVVNMSNIQYAGSNSDLLALRDGLEGLAAASFTGETGTNLSDLVNGEATIGNYSGRFIAPIPEPSAALLFSIGALVVGGAVGRRH